MLTDKCHRPAGKRNRTDLDESLPGDVAVKIRGKPAEKAAVANESRPAENAASSDDSPRTEIRPSTLRVVGGDIR